MHGDTPQHSKYCAAGKPGLHDPPAFSLDGLSISGFCGSMPSPWFEQTHPLLLLAPMDGYTDSAFRRICKTMDARLVVFTEFTSVDGLHFAREKVSTRFRFHDDEHPIVAQIFGNNIDNFTAFTEDFSQGGWEGWFAMIQPQNNTYLSLV